MILSSLSSRFQINTLDVELQILIHFKYNLNSNEPLKQQSNVSELKLSVPLHLVTKIKLNILLTT